MFVLFSTRIQDTEARGINGISFEQSLSVCFCFPRSYVWVISGGVTTPCLWQPQQDCGRVLFIKKNLLLSKSLFLTSSGSTMAFSSYSKMEKFINHHEMAIVWGGVEEKEKLDREGEKRKKKKERKKIGSVIYVYDNSTKTEKGGGGGGSGSRRRVQSWFIRFFFTLTVKKW